MEMVLHQAVSVDLSARRLAGLSQGLLEIPSIRIIQENAFTTITTSPHACPRRKLGEEGW